MKLIKKIFLMMVFAMVLSACRTPLTVPKTVTGYTQSQIERAILESGKVRGWQMKKESNGLITGSINVKGSIANIRVPYTQNSYSINYVSGSRPDGSKQPPANYGRWAVKLGQDIEVRLSRQNNK